MKILLLSMPDSFEHTPTVSIRMPNGALSSLAGKCRPAPSDPEELEFLRWRAEHWMKLRHLPSVFIQHPVFLLRHGAKILVHMFRGTTFKTLLGLENEHKAVERYRAMRQAERVYV